MTEPPKSVSRPGQDMYRTALLPNATESLLKERMPYVLYNCINNKKNDRTLFYRHILDIHVESPEIKHIVQSILSTQKQTLFHQPFIDKEGKHSYYNMGQTNHPIPFGCPLLYIKETKDADFVFGQSTPDYHDLYIMQSSSEPLPDPVVYVKFSYQQIWDDPKTTTLQGNEFLEVVHKATEKNKFSRIKEYRMEGGEKIITI